MTMINSYSVGIGLNAKGLVDGGVLARREITALTRTMHGLVTPAEKLKGQLDLVEKAIQSGTGDANILQQTYDRLQKKLNELTESQAKTTAETERAALAQQKAARMADMNAEAKKRLALATKAESDLERKSNQLQMQGLSLSRAVETAQERYNRQIKEAIALRRQDAISRETLIRLNQQYKNELNQSIQAEERAAAATRKASLMRQAIANSGGPRVNTPTPRMGGGGGGGNGMGLLLLSQFIDDAQYGIKGIVNNIPGLVMAFGGSMKLAGGLGIAAVAINQVAKAFEDGTLKSEKFTKSVDYLSAGLAEVGKAAEPLSKGGGGFISDTVLGLGRGLGFIVAGATDLVTLNTSLEHTNALIDKYKKETDDAASDAKFKHEMMFYIPPVDAYAESVKRMNAEYEKHIKLTEQMAAMQKPWVEENNRWQGQVGGALDSARSGLIGTRVGTDGSTLIDMAREAAANNLKLGVSKDHEGWAAAQEKFLNGTIKSYKEYNGLLTEEQRLQIASLEAMQKKAAKAKEDDDNVKKRQQEAEASKKRQEEESKREREQLFAQGQKEREQLDKMVALRSRIGEIEKMYRAGAINSETARQLHSNAVEDLAMQRVGLPPANVAADLGTQEAYKVLTGQKDEQQEKQFVLMEQQKIEMEMAGKTLAEIKKELQKSPVLRDARSSTT